MSKTTIEESNVQVTETRRNKLTQTTMLSRLRLIEDLFHKYPEVPQELVIKQDVLSLGQQFSDRALAAAAGADKKVYELFSSDLVPMSAMSRQEYSKVPRYFYIKGGPYNLRPVGLRTGIATDSPYLIDVIDGRLKLLLDGAAIADVGYPSPLKYCSKSFPDGSSYQDIIANGSHVTVFHSCQFWGVREECKFCDINENARQVKKFKPSTLAAPVKTVEQVAIVANEIAKEVLETEGYPAPICFGVTGGAITTQVHGLGEDEFYLRYVEAIKEGGPRRYVRLAMGAKDKTALKEYHRRGVDLYTCNLEVWDKRLFQWICPGKSQRVGWEEWVKRLVDAVDVFGERHVLPTFVCGIEMARPYGFKTIDEAVRSTTEGIRFLMSNGVMPRFNQWIREPGAYLQKKYNQPPVPPEFYLHLMRNYYENWKRYDLPLPSLMYASPEERVIGSGRGFDDDYLLIMEQKDYESRALRSLEKVGTIWND
ncbi:MAG: hypothetical protein HY673_06915 [Chloroflexi bacterium]|nr:hypothetical protein [Chloroflexota bacterium]